MYYNVQYTLNEEILETLYRDSNNKANKPTLKNAINPSDEITAHNNSNNNGKTLQKENIVGT